jgi:hypothetical protein
MRMVFAVGAIALLLAFTLATSVPALARDLGPPGDPGPSCGFPTGECCEGEICVELGFCKAPSGACFNCPCPGECPVQCPTAAPALSWPMLSALIVLLMGGGLYLARQQR